LEFLIAEQYVATEGGDSNGKYFFAVNFKKEAIFCRG